MMQLSMTGEYAVRAMIHLASVPSGAVVQINEIAAKWDIPDKFLRKIIQLLTRSGLVVSQRGIGGGVALSRPAKDISLLEVIEAAEGKIYLNKCLVRPGMCIRDSWCAVHLVWRDVQDSMIAILQSKSLAQLAQTSQKRKSQLATTA